MNTEIKEWLEGSRDYEEGVALFVKYGGNRAQARVFQNTAARFAIKSLTYELTKLAKSTTSVAVAAKKPLAKAAAKEKVEPQNNIPEVAALAKKIVHETWVELSRINEELHAIGEANDDKSIAARKALMDEREPLIERYNTVYEAKESFFAGEMTEEQLKAVIDGKPKEEPKADSQPNKEMTDLDITKRLHALKTNITRSQNRLDYQQEKKGKEKNPMPDCPKRQKLEAKLKEMQAEYKALQAEAKKRGLNGKA